MERYMNPFAIAKNLYRHRDIIRQLTKREVIARYQGSYLGILWSFINPIMMLAVYTFFFGTILKARWGTSTNNLVEFSLVLFCGLITFNLFSETVGRASSLVIANPNFVKKVVFPLEVLPIVTLGSAMIHGAISFTILMVGLVLFAGKISPTFFYLPIVLMPLVLSSLGFSWFLASLGVFVRDLSQIINLVLQFLIFLSPVFYPITAVPKEFRPYFFLNPLTYVVEDARRIMLGGQPPHWEWLMLGLGASLILFVVGHAWFQLTRNGFADVL